MAPRCRRNCAGTLGALLIRSTDGRTVQLHIIAKVGIAVGQRQITRERLEGKDLASAIRDVQATVAGLHLPPAIRVDYGGLYVQQRQSFSDLTTVFVKAARHRDRLRSRDRGDAGADIAADAAARL